MIYELEAGGDEWRQAGQLHFLGRAAHCVISTDTMIVITGGANGGNFESLSTVERWTPGEKRARKMGRMRSPRKSHGCTSYDTGEPGETVVMVAGGMMDRWWLETVERMTVTL